MSLISKGLLRALREMRDAEDRGAYEEAEIVYSQGECWLGDRRISTRTLQAGLYLCLFRSEGIGGSYERHTLNEDGSELANDPDNYIPRILRMTGT
jgi:hypothetical protein